ncbi:hypothetical protein IQ277_02800 [Nostocales cyanobacterium LEGE 12452]|nr:hypothetical protein [Nostocales cyanobacterium LEGE 12452]
MHRQQRDKLIVLDQRHINMRGNINCLIPCLLAGYVFGVVCHIRNDHRLPRSMVICQVAPKVFQMVQSAQFGNTARVVLMNDDLLAAG